MANQSSFILHKKLDRKAIASKIAIGLSKPLGFSRNHDSLEQKKMDSTRILGSQITDSIQDHKSKCFEELVIRRERIMAQQNVEDVKCALEAEVIDDTALIETTAVVTGFKNRYRNETNAGYGKHHVNDGKKKPNKVFKKQGERCSMKCQKEQQLDTKRVEDKDSSEKKIPEGKGQKVHTKMPARAKYVYQMKDTKIPKMVATDVEAHQKIENLNVTEKIFGDTMQETDLNSKVSTGIEKDPTTKLVDIEPAIENNETEGENVRENTTVGSKKIVYSREEIEALRSVDEEGQKSKWFEVYSGFAPMVAKEYTGLVVDANNRQPQRYTRVVNCGSTSHVNALLSMPPVLPLCSPSNCI